MKRLTLLLAIVPFCFAQDSQADHYGPPQLASLKIEAPLTPAGGFAAFRVSYQLERVASDPSGKRETQPVKGGTFDLMQSQDRTLVDGIVAAVARDWELRQRLAMPAHRKDLRER